MGRRLHGNGLQQRALAAGERYVFAYPTTLCWIMFDSAGPRVDLRRAQRRFEFNANMTKTTGVTLAIVGLVAFGAAGYWYGSRNTIAPVGAGGSAAATSAPASGGGGAKGAPPVITVEATTVVLSPMPQTITAVGSLRSDESVTLRPEVAGRIAEIRFKEGQQVAKGAVLVRLDDSVISADAEQARANLWMA